MPDCSNCVHHKEQSIPFAAHESIKATMERTVKRLWILALVLIILLCATNALWVIRESQFADEVISIEQEGETDGGGNNYFNGTGELTINGEGSAEDNG